MSFIKKYKVLTISIIIIISLLIYGIVAIILSKKYKDNSRKSKSLLSSGIIIFILSLIGIFVCIVIINFIQLINPGGYLYEYLINPIIYPEGVNIN
jgi:hypothetical protein